MGNNIHTKANIKLGILLYLSLLLLTGCQYSYQLQHNYIQSIQIAQENISVEQFDAQSLSKLTFVHFENGSKVGLNPSDKSTIFKIKIENDAFDKNKDYSIAVMPHYIAEVAFFNSELKNVELIKRNGYLENRQYSPNLFAINIKNHDQFYYILVKKRVPKNILFIVDDRIKLKNYDQKLSMTTTVIYSIILTLIFVNFVFFLFIRDKSYLYFSLYIFSGLIVLLFAEGTIAYSNFLSRPIFGIYTQVIWLKLQSIFYWLLIIQFLDLKTKKTFDAKLSRIMLKLEIAMIALILLLSFSGNVSIYPKLSVFINVYVAISVFVAIYIPIKQALLGNKNARFLSIGLILHTISILLRIYYAMTLDPLSYWMPRLFEYGLMFLAIFISLGLAEKSLRYKEQKDSAERKYDKIDRELFSKEINNNFHLRCNKTIGKFFGTEKQLNTMLNSYFISALQQYIAVDDVFYVSEQGAETKVSRISGHVVDFNIQNFINMNAQVLNGVCEKNEALYKICPVENGTELPFFIIPINQKKFDNLCLFLTLPKEIKGDNRKLSTELAAFVKQLTASYINCKNFQKTVKSSRFDALTNVLNRKSIMDKIDQLISLSKSNNGTVSVAFIDVDDFKDVNDRYGHSVGDDVLVFLSQKLQKEFVINTFVGRFGGDEFIVVFNNATAKQIDDSMNNLYQYFSINAIHNINLKLSIGIATATVENKLLDSKKLLKAADTALYHSKDQGKNQFSFYS